MTENNEPIFFVLNEEEVVDFREGWLEVNKELGFNSLLLAPVLRVNQFEFCIQELINMNQSSKAVLFSKEGIPGQALRFGKKGWEKGKLRAKITVEFCPDEPEPEETPSSKPSAITPPESPLDDLRRQLFNQEPNA
ncbi:MAG: KGK domain-containing protein [Actinomycetota bacterium]